MQRVLGLDISSSTIGWALIKFNDEIVELESHGHIKPPAKKKGCMGFRLSTTSDEIRNLIKNLSPDIVAVEDYAKKFSSKKSSAHTIIVLATFNEVCAMIAYQELGKDVWRCAATSIRSILSKHFDIKSVSKDEIFSVIQTHCKRFETKMNRIGNTKTESKDEADAVAVSLAYVLEEYNNGQTYRI